MAKLPCWHFYPGDWFKDTAVQALDHLSRDVWHTLLLHMFESERRGYLLVNNAAMPDEMIANLVKLPIKKWRKVKKTILDFGVASLDEKTGALFNRRMVRDEVKRQEFVKNAQESGRLGGNPAFMKGHANPYYDKGSDKGQDKGRDKGRVISDPYVKDKGEISSSSSSSFPSSRENKRRGPVHTVDNHASASRKSASPSPPSPLGLAQEEGISEGRASPDADGFIGTEPTMDEFDKMIRQIAEKRTMPGTPAEGRR